MAKMLIERSQKYHQAFLLSDMRLYMLRHTFVPAKLELLKILP